MIDRRHTIIEELKTLRKGSGLTSRKLHEATELRKTIAERLHLETGALSIGQMMNYLLRELNNLGDSIEARATRNAFGIGWEQNTHNLLKRRTDFSEQLKRHPDTVETYENQNIEELAFRLLNTVHSQGDASTNGNVYSLSPQSSGVQLEYAQSAAQNMIAQGLNDLYSLGQHSSEILKYFNGKGPYLETNAEWLLLPSKKGEDWCNYKFRYTFRGQIKSYKVGIAASPYDGELLMTSGLVDDVLTITNVEDMDTEITDLLSQSHFMFHDQDTGEQHVLKFTEMGKSARQELLSIIWRLDTATVGILELEIPPKGQRPGTLYEYRHSFNILINSLYAYWYSPGLMYLNNLVIDFTQFPNREQWKFFIQPFLGLITPGILKANGDRYVLSPNSWIMEGHGVALIWGKTD